MDNHKKSFQSLIWLNAIIAVGMSSCVFTGQLKIMIETGYGMLVFPAANIFFGLLTFPITDVIADVYGKKEAKRAVMIGFISQFATISIVQISLLFPGETSALEPFAFGGWRVLLGSLIAYFAAQYWDIWVFHLIKEKWTGEKHLWLRNNLSTFTSQIINSSLFIGIVFGFEALAAMLISSIIVKSIIAIIDTPLVYFIRYYVRKDYKNGKQEKVYIRA